MRTFECVLVTGGAGFIGSNFIRHLFGTPGFRGKIVNLDALTYAGSLDNLSDIEKAHGGSRYTFIKGDICDRAAVQSVFGSHRPDAVAHFAAETHVDRSITAPDAFVRTNVLGTSTLLDAARRAWEGRQGTLFHHVSTDEVFGSLGETGRFTEETPYAPRSPYAASKAGSDHLVMAAHHTYGLPVTLSNSSNNYGASQFPEKLIPLVILNLLDGAPIPVYGDGRNVRDWLYVEDHAAGIWKVMTEGKLGERYNLGGNDERENIQLVRDLCAAVARRTGTPLAVYERLITHVTDRPGHDRRYAMDSAKARRELGWQPRVGLAEGLDRTVGWYIDNADRIRMLRNRTSGAQGCP